MSRTALAGILICLLVMVSCAHGTSTDPVTLQLSENEEIWVKTLEMIPPGRSLMGFYRVTVNTNTLETTAVPLRSTAWHLNALKFLEPPSGGSLISFSNTSINKHKVEIDVTIKHPFGGMPHFCGFDVKGIVIGAADILDPNDPTRLWAGGPSGLRLLNADGWTRWWNPIEFPDNGTIFSYREGLYGTTDKDSVWFATLSGYKVFAASLDPEESLSHILAVPLEHPNGRSVFHSSGIETRHYELVFPGDGQGGPDLVFNYAIDASHGFPPGYKPGEYIEVPDGFPPDANQLEPFVIDVNMPLNTVYLSEDGCVGGQLVLYIRVSDWQALLNGTPVDDQISSIELTSPTLFIGSRTPDFVSDWTPDMPWATYGIMLEGITPDSILDQQILVTVVSEEGDYQQDVSSYEGDSPLSSFFVVRVPVSQKGPIGGTGFAIDPLSPWPKPGGSIHNSNYVDIHGPGDPDVTWDIADITTNTMPVVDSEGRIFLSRPLADGGIAMLIYDPNGYQVADNQFPDFESAGDPILIGCSLLFNDKDGNVGKLYQDGGYEPLFTPVLGVGPHFLGLMNVDNDGHGFVHGPSSIQAFDQYGSLLWVRYGIDGTPSMFIGPPTIAGDGLVVVGKVDLDGPPLDNFAFWGLNAENGEIVWTHTPVFDDEIPYGSAADPLTGQIYYTVTNHVVALRDDGSQRWIYEGKNCFLDSVAIAVDGTIFAAQSVPGQTGGTSTVVALNLEGQLLWELEYNDGITAGPITDSDGNVYIANGDGVVRCLGLDSSLRWDLDVGGRPTYLIFGSNYSLLVGIQESLFKIRLVCIRDIG